jgi:hypothetical protein
MGLPYRFVHDFFQGDGRLMQITYTLSLISFMVILSTLITDSEGDDIVAGKINIGEQ